MALPIAPAATSSIAPSMGSTLGMGFAAGIGQGASSGLMGTLFGGIQARRQWKYLQKQMALQQQYQLEQMEKQAQYQKDYFDYQNAYNDPSKVLARYRAAGVNAAAVLGNSGSSMSATMPGGSAPSGGPIGGTPVGTSTPFADASGTSALLNSQIKSNLGNAANANAAAEDHKSNAALNSSKILTEDAYRNYLGEVAETETYKRWELSSRALLDEATTATENTLRDQRLQQLIEQTNLLIAEQGLTDEQSSLVKNQAATEICRRFLVQAQAKDAKTHSELNDALRSYYETLHSDVSARLHAALKVRSYSYVDPTTKQEKTITMSANDAAAYKALIDYLDAQFISARDGIVSSWENANQWKETISTYGNLAIDGAGVFISGARAKSFADMVKTMQQTADAQSKDATTRRLDQMNRQTDMDLRRDLEERKFDYQRRKDLNEREWQLERYKRAPNRPKPW